jgi:hypothetical protein
MFPLPYYRVRRLALTVSGKKHQDLLYFFVNVHDRLCGDPDPGGKFSADPCGSGSEQSIKPRFYLRGDNFTFCEQLMLDTAETLYKIGFGF